MFKRSLWDNFLRPRVLLVEIGGRFNLVNEIIILAPKSDKKILTTV